MHSVIPGGELRARVKRLGMTYARAAELLGLSLDGLNKQMRGTTPVSQQTAIILILLETLPRLNEKRRMEAMQQMERLRDQSPPASREFVFRRAMAKLGTGPRRL
jgi:hypothetical protein